jgi:hypothetical protein
MKLFDLGTVEPELSENFVIVLAQAGRAPCRFLCNAVHLHGAADRKRQLASRALERNDDVVGAQLRVIDDLGGIQNRSVGDVGFVEDLAPVRIGSLANTSSRIALSCAAFVACFAGSLKSGSVTKSDRPMPVASAGNLSGVTTSMNQLPSDAL